jgi:hypothetical protein
MPYAPEPPRVDGGGWMPPTGGWAWRCQRCPVIFLDGKIALNDSDFWPSLYYRMSRMITADAVRALRNKKADPPCTEGSANP